MRLLVCGGRDFANPTLLWRTLDAIDNEQAIRCVIDGASDDVTGGYVGADYWGHEWALARNRPTVRIFAEWKRYGRAAGPIRNQRMIDECGPDMVVAFQGGRGTEDMVRRAETAGIVVRRA